MPIARWFNLESSPRRPLWQLISALACAAVAGAGLAGCGEHGPSVEAHDTNVSRGNVAILDLQAVAARLGRSDEMKEVLSERGEELQSKLSTLKGDLQTKLDQKSKEIEEANGVADPKKLAQLQQDARGELNRALQQAQGELQKEARRTVMRFREEVKPVARRVARDRGLQIILTKNEAVVFEYDSAVDMTDAVVGEMIVREGAAKPASSGTPEDESPL
jgi:Skp family chaperone for outer membrane proteins